MCFGLWVSENTLMHIHSSLTARCRVWRHAGHRPTACRGLHCPVSLPQACSPVQTTPSRQRRSSEDHYWNDKSDTNFKELPASLLDHNSRLERKVQLFVHGCLPGNAVAVNHRQEVVWVGDGVGQKSSQLTLMDLPRFCFKKLTNTNKPAFCQRGEVAFLAISCYKSLRRIIQQKKKL